MLSKILAYGLWISLKILLRKTSVFLVISTIIALSTVVTLALIASEYPLVLSQVVSRYPRHDVGLIIGDGEVDVRICWGFLAYEGRGLEVLVLTSTMDSSFWRYYKFREVDPSSIIVGYRVSEVLELRSGSLANLTVNGETFNVKVAFVTRFNNFLDSTIITSYNITGCSMGYKLSSYNPLDVVSAISRELSHSLTQWYLVSLIALTVAVALASLKAVIDVREDVLILDAQGVPRGLMLLALLSSFTFSTLTGVSYGFVLSSIVVSVLGSYTGVYIPSPSPTSWLLVRVLLIPVLVSVTTPLIVGVILWRFRG